MVGLGESAAHGIKSGVRELLAPYHTALAVAGGWRPGRSARTADPDASSQLARLQRMETLERENDELRRLLGLEKRLAFHTLPAVIMARDGAAGWWRSVRLNKGAQDGVRTNQAVIAESGVLGVVREVSPHTAEVLLLSDPGCRISVRCGRTGDFGLLVGGGVLGRDGVMEMLLPAEPGEMTYIPRESTIREGDGIVTSGLGGVFPEGLLVGRVSKVEPAHSGLYLNARIVPAADLARLRHVLILTGAREAGRRAP
jgi:rod shape-determining protein MreC